MLQLTPEECRVLGVLVEKAHTTPNQYPMSVNAIINACNQKNNRDPVVNYSEQTVYDTLDSLRRSNLARQVELSGSRVAKFRHIARETLELDTSQLIILTELLLRGPSTLGELRSRASRMRKTPFESIEVVSNILDSLMHRDEPFVKKLAPPPGARAEMYVQLLGPTPPPPEVAAQAPGLADSGRDESARTESASRHRDDADADADRDVQTASHSPPSRDAGALVENHTDDRLRTLERTVSDLAARVEALERGG